MSRTVSSWLWLVLHYIAILMIASLVVPEFSLAFVCNNGNRCDAFNTLYWSKKMVLTFRSTTAISQCSKEKMDQLRDQWNWLCSNQLLIVVKDSFDSYFWIFDDGRMIIRCHVIIIWYISFGEPIISFLTIGICPSVNQCRFRCLRKNWLCEFWFRRDFPRKDSSLEWQTNRGFYLFPDPSRCIFGWVIFIFYLGLYRSNFTHVWCLCVKQSLKAGTPFSFLYRRVYNLPKGRRLGFMWKLQGETVLNMFLSNLRSRVFQKIRT